MKSITLPCDTDAGDTVTLARIGGCAGVTVRAKQHQVNLNPADARQAAAWLVACADEVEASLARVRAERDCLPGCRTRTGAVNVGFCPKCKAALDELVEIAQEHGLGYEVTP